MARWERIKDVLSRLREAQQQTSQEKAPAKQEQQEQSQKAPQQGKSADLTPEARPAVEAARSVKLPEMQEASRSELGNRSPRPTPQQEQTQQAGDTSSGAREPQARILHKEQARARQRDHGHER